MSSKAEGITKCSDQEGRLSTPLERWLNVNIHVTYKLRRATLVVIVCDHRVCVLFLAFDLEEALSPWTTKLKALCWEHFWWTGSLVIN